MRGGHVRGASARRRAAWLTGELAAARTSVSGGRGCIRCNESGWLPGRACGATDDAELPRDPRSCGAGRVPLAGSGDDAPDATGCSRMHRDASRRNDDAGHATESAASLLHQVRADGEVPGHRSRAAVRPAEGAAGPHAAPQAARVHANCRMMHQMQLCSLAAGSGTSAAAHERTRALGRRRGGGHRPGPHPGPRPPTGRLVCDLRKAERIST